MKNIFYLFIILACISCEEVIELDLPLKDKRLVVDGLITNQDTACIVKLSYSSKYDFRYDLIHSNAVQGATVIVKDDLGNIDTLSELTPGKYVDQKRTIIQEIGRTYTLEIYTTQGEIWLSEPETMLPVPDIDSMYYERDVNDVSEDNPGYYKYSIYVDWRDSLNFDNYYLRNIQYMWANVWRSDISWNWVFDDKYIDGDHIKKNLLMEDYGGRMFYVRLNQYSLTPKAYRFWNLVHEQTQGADNDIINSGVPLYGNVYNANNTEQYSLGYFQVSAHTINTIYIDE